MKNFTIYFLMVVFIVGFTSCRGKSGCAALYLLMQEKPIVINSRAPGSSQVTFNKSGPFDFKLNPKYGLVSVDIRKVGGTFSESVFTNASYEREGSVYIPEKGDYTVRVSGSGTFRLEIK